ncbi:MAG: hypothetical protein KC503_33125 [Myxococcales bacterium]|nr:hypothetical protein [Myxococcales bacterium]
MSNPLASLQQALDGDHEALSWRWVEAIVQRTWQLRGQKGMQSQLRERCANVLESLALIGEGTSSSELGSPVWRESLQRLSFAAGWMAGADLPVSAAAAMCFALRDAVGGQSCRFYEDLALVAVEAYNAGVKQQAAAVHRQIVEKSQVVCLLPDALPCLFLVADPDKQALDDAVGRLMMLAVVRDAGAFIVDCAGLYDPETTLRRALPIFADHRKEPPPHLMLASVTPALASRLEAVEQPTGVRAFEELADAIAAARGQQQG